MEKIQNRQTNRNIQYKTWTLIRELMEMFWFKHFKWSKLNFIEKVYFPDQAGFPSFFMIRWFRFITLGEKEDQVGYR